MYEGGSGLYLMMQVKLIILPLSTWRSGPPRMEAVGTGKGYKEFLFYFGFWHIVQCTDMNWWPPQAK